MVVPVKEHRIPLRQEGVGCNAVGRGRAAEDKETGIAAPHGGCQPFRRSRHPFVGRGVADGIGGVGNICPEGAFPQGFCKEPPFLGKAVKGPAVVAGGIEVFPLLRRLLQKGPGKWGKNAVVVFLFHGCLLSAYYIVSGA